MRPATFFKVFWFVTLAIATSLVTASIVAQTKRTRKAVAPKNAQVEPVHSWTTARTRQVQPGEIISTRPTPEEEVARFLGSKVRAEGTLLGYGASVNGREVSVWTNVQVMDKSAGSSYVWALRVLQGRPSAPKVVLDRYYDHQIFHMPGDTVQMAPTFKETIELAPGTYHVEVSLYRIPAPFDLGKLQDESFKGRARVSRSVNTVVVFD